MIGRTAHHELDFFRVYDRDVQCPACGSLAQFVSPFQMLSGADAENAVLNPGVRTVPYRDKVVVELFPDLFPWNDSKNRELNWRAEVGWGVISCGHCPFRKKHHLSWPDDAFYKIAFPFGTLWVTFRECLPYLRECIANPKLHGGGYRNALAKEFFLARNRARILRGIDELLAKPERKTP